MSEKFDLFEGLGKLGKKNHNWYKSLDDSGKKAAAPFVIARWMVGTSDQAQLVRMNTFVNPYLFSLGQEKGLLFGLLAAAATGKNSRYNWIKSPGAKSSPKMKLEVIKQFYEVSTREAELYIKNISDSDIIEMSEDLGWEKEQTNLLKKELNDGTGITKSKSAKPKK